MSQRLATVAVVAIILQIGITAIRSYFDEIDLASNYVRYEARSIMSAYAGKDSGGKYELPARYRGKTGGDYAFRILSREGSTLAEHNGHLLATLSPWRFPLSETQDFWLRRPDAKRWMHVAGGMHLSAGGNDVWVEVATQGDPAGAHLSIFARELLADVWIPMIPLVVLTLGVAILTVRRSLQTLVNAADKADTLTVLRQGERLDTDQLPREAASLAIAINGLLDRVTELVNSQRLFLARAAHELRTPLSIMLLELGNIDDARARRLEGDVQVMSELVDRLLTLSRLEAIERLESLEVDLAELATAVVERMAHWAMQTRHELKLVVVEPAVIDADKFAVREALRNLIENAVRHSPEQTQVVVEIGPGAKIAVHDAGTGIDVKQTSRLLEPFARGATQAEGSGLGLAIVAQVAALHHADLHIGTSRLGGAVIELVFPNPSPQ